MRQERVSGMRVLICGDRNWTDEKSIEKYIRSLPEDSVIIHGACRGADMIADKWAIKCGLEVDMYPAEWAYYGKSAGPIRNKVMLGRGRPDIVVAFHDNISRSRGTADMLRHADALGVPTEVRRSNKEIRE